MIKVNRLYNWLYATVNGYFWLPCPICGKNFGGHEAAGESLMDNLHSGTLVCPACEGEAKRRNREKFRAYPGGRRELSMLGKGYLKNEKD